MLAYINLYLVYGEFYKSTKIKVKNMPAYKKTAQKVEATVKEVFSEIYNFFNLSEEIRNYRPKDNGWTINEVLEHITLTSHYLMIVLRHSYPKALKRSKGKDFLIDEESNLELLNIIGQKGSFTWVRPEHMEPIGNKSIEEILILMKEQEAECLEILKKLENGAGSFCKIRMSVADTGKIDLYQWIYFLAQHAQRHIQQMLENKLEYQIN